MIWNCYREITTAEKLLDDMEKLRKEHRFDESAQKLKDAFGSRRDLQLGIPSGSNSRRLFNVRPRLAESVIRAHISEKKAELIAANERAVLELNTEDDQ